MKTFGTAFQAIIDSTTKAPRYAIKIYFDEAGTNYTWVTSHPGTLLPGGETEYTHDVVKNFNGTSQQIFPDEGRSTVGAISFKVRDVDMGSIIRTNLDAGRGLNGQKVEVYVGDETLTSWSEYELFQTQIVKGISFAGNWYSFKCTDIQRTSKVKLFTPKTTTINATVADDDTTIGAAATDSFELVAHGTSYTDAPSTTVGYIQIEDEIIRYTGKTASSFTGCARGVLNTKAATHELADGADEDRQTEIKEVVYLEMPAPKLAYAILTGILYDQGGATLPDHWNLGISTTFVQTSAFTDPSLLDWWNPSDDSEGVILRFVGIEEEDGKKFVEKQINYVLGAFMPITADGSYSYLRQTSVLTGSAYIKTLDATNLTHAGTLLHDFNLIANKYQVNWNWDSLTEKFTRGNELIDANSITTHGEGDKVTVDAHGLHGSRFTAALISQRFSSLSDRYAGPPLKIQVKGNLTLAGLDVGDIIRLTLDQIRDYSGEVTSIDRAMEVQKVSVNWASGSVTLDLFGSSQASAAITHETSTTALPDAFYGNVGTEINTTNFPTGYTPGAVSHFDGNNTLVGAATLAAGTYWHDGDLQIDSGILIAATNGNVQINVKGHLQINGDTDSSGEGHAGTVGTTAVNGAAGTVGYIGSTRGYGGGTLQKVTTASGFVISKESTIANGSVSSIPTLELEVSGNTLVGLPTDLRGTSGGAGGAINYDSGTEITNGKNGGNSGGGLVIVSRGVSFGGSGGINTSGDDGIAGTTDGTIEGAVNLFAGGGGGGAPGACIIIIDGSSAVSPTLANVTCDMGASSTSGTRLSQVNNVVHNANNAERSYFESISGQGGSAAKRIFRLVGVQSPTEDIPQEADAVSAISLAEFTNTPKSAKANLSTIEVTVTPPSDPNYLYSNIYYKYDTASFWIKVDAPAQPETTFIVSSDGETYDVKAHAVSTKGVESPTSVAAQITIKNVTDPSPSDGDPSEFVTIPNVNGLELFEQGNDTEFDGKDAKFAWRGTSVTEFIDVGGSDQSALSASLDLYFMNWEVKIYDSSLNLMRVESVTDNWFLYSHEKNREDYLRVNKSVGANRSFTITVVMRVQFSDKVSPREAKLSVSNPLPVLSATPVITPLSQAGKASFVEPTDTDYSKIEFRVTLDTGSLGDSGTLTFDGTTSPITLTGLASSTDYIWDYRLHDEFGPGAYSTDGTLTTGAAADADEIAGLGNWATRLTDVDQTFIEANMGVDALPSTRIQSVVAGKIAAGTISTRVAVSGVFVATATTLAMNETGLSGGTWRLDMGPVADSGTTYVIRFHDGNGNSTFHIDELGNLTTEGNITGSRIQGSSFTTTGTYLTVNALAAATVLNVDDTSDFTSSGDGWILDATNDRDAFSWTGITATTLTGCTGVLAHATNAIVIPQEKQILLSESLNEQRFYGDRGDGTVEELASIGTNLIDGDSVIGNFGSSASEYIAVKARGNSSAPAIYGRNYATGAGVGGYFEAAGTSASLYAYKESGAPSSKAIEVSHQGALGGYGIYVFSSVATGAYSISSTGIGVEGVSGGTTYAIKGTATLGYGGAFFGGKAPIFLNPFAGASRPTHSANKGSMGLDSSARPYINTNGSTTWQSFKDLGFSGCQAYATSNQALTSGVWAAVTMATENYDVDPSGAGYHTTGSDFTAQITGYYRITANVSINDTKGTPTLGVKAITFWKNGALFNGGAYSQITSANAFERLNIASTVYLTAGQYVSVAAYHTSGASVQAQGNGQVTHMSIERVGV